MYRVLLLLLSSQKTLQINALSVLRNIIGTVAVRLLLNFKHKKRLVTHTANLHLSGFLILVKSL